MARALTAAAAGGLLLTGVAWAASPYATLDTFARVLTTVQASFVEPVDQTALVHASLGGLVGALDAHSAFYDPAAWRRVQEANAGQYVGLGVETWPAACGRTVVDLVPRGPSASAGLQAGDCLVSVDGVALAGLTPDATEALLRGNEGEAVTLEVSRDGVTRSVVLLRSRVIAPAVEGERLEDGVVVARIRVFREHTSTELAAVLDGLSPVRAVVLDVRGNPGGRLDEAAAAVDQFVRAGTIVRTDGRAPGATGRIEARDQPTDRDVPVVVLVDGTTASAAEILAGALRELRGATLVGERTYGKGTVQTVSTYEDGSALKLTTGRYFLPNGDPVPDQVGLQPDVPVAGQADPAGALRSRIDRTAGLSAEERAALHHEVDLLHGPPPAPPGRTGPLASRIALDPALAEAVRQARRPPTTPRR